MIAQRFYVHLHLVIHGRIIIGHHGGFVVIKNVCQILEFFKPYKNFNFPFNQIRIHVFESKNSSNLFFVEVALL